MAPLRLLPLTALILAILLVGCGSGDDGEGTAGFDRVAGEIEGLDAGARERKLRELAREEGGKLDVYTSLIDKSAKAVAEEFERAYGIEVSVFQSESEVVARRVSEESKAGRRGTDVVDTSGQDMVALGRADAFVPYEPSGLAQLAEGSRQKGWTATRTNKFVVGWNTDRVRGAEVPRSIEDLADPRWRGRVALEGSDADWYRTIHEFWTGEGGKSEQEADRLFEGIARNARVAPSHGSLSELLGAGEFDATPTTYLHLVRDSRDEGAPVAFEPVVEPVAARPNGVALLRTADRPAAAILFVEWLTGRGQEVLRDNNVEPVRRDLSTLDAKEIPIDVEAFADDAQAWKDRYDELIRDSERASE